MRINLLLENLKKEEIPISLTEDEKVFVNGKVKDKTLMKALKEHKDFLAYLLKHNKIVTGSAEISDYDCLLAFLQFKEFVISTVIITDYDERLYEQFRILSDIIISSDSEKTVKKAEYAYLMLEQEQEYEDSVRAPLT